MFKFHGCLSEKSFAIIFVRSSGVGRDSPWRADGATDLAQSLFLILSAVSPV
jgi:hypothetical protein